MDRVTNNSLIRNACLAMTLIIHFSKAMIQLNKPENPSELSVLGLEQANLIIFKQSLHT